MIIELEPFDVETDRMEEMWHPYDLVYTEIGIPILSMYYKKFSIEMGMETELKREDLHQLLYTHPMYSDLEYEAASLIFLVLQNLDWEVDRLAFNDIYSLDNPQEYIRDKNVEISEIYPHIKEQIQECIGTDCIFYCIKNKKIGQFLKSNTNEEIDRILNNLHPLFYQNSWFGKEINGVYYIAFSIGICWDAPITFCQIHPNFYNLAYAIDQRIDKEIGEK